MKKFFLLLPLLSSFAFADRYNGSDELIEEVRIIQEILVEMLETQNVLLSNVYDLKRVATGEMRLEELPPFIRQEHLEQGKSNP